MIRAIRDWLSYRAMRARWDYEGGAWIAGDWRIELVTSGLAFALSNHWTGYRVTYKGSQQGSLHTSLRRAMEAVDRLAQMRLPIRKTGLLNRLADFLTADARAEHAQVGRPDIVSRPRPGDVRDTAAAMIPPDTED